MRRAGTDGEVGSTAMDEATGGAPAEDADRERVAAVLERVRAGVEQRQAELATVEAERDDRRLALVELQRLEWVEEPVPWSARPGIGRLAAFVRKAFFHLFHKWHARPVLQRQNAFNQAAVRMLRDLSAREEAAGRRAAELARRVGELERRLAALDGQAAADGTGGADGADGPPAGGRPGR